MDFTVIVSVIIAKIIADSTRKPLNAVPDIEAEAENKMTAQCLLMKGADIALFQRSDVLRALLSGDIPRTA